MHLFSDASPVTGTELQGMILQIVYATGLIECRVMPGVALWFGFTRTIDKLIALLWSLMLICGPDLKVLRFALDKIRSITTDMGTELGLLDMPDLAPSFLKMGCWRNS